MQRTTVSGMEDLYRAFRELPKATGKAQLKGLARDVLEPMRATASARAPRRTGALAAKVVISDKKRRRTNAGKRYDGPQAYAVSMGPSGVGIIRGLMQEFGTFKEPAQPYMRPAWDAHADLALEDIKRQLWDRIEKAAARVARKNARAAAKVTG